MRACIFDQGSIRRPGLALLIARPFGRFLRRVLLERPEAAPQSQHGPDGTAVAAPPGNASTTGVNFLLNCTLVVISRLQSLTMISIDEGFMP
jgi:hypothetical protein